jgi:hypothetical protein
MSFAEVVQGRDATVRVTPDGLLYAVDLVMVITGKERHHAAKTLKTIPQDLFQRDKISLWQSSRSGGKATSLISFSDALELIQILPG